MKKNYSFIFCLVFAVSATIFFTSCTQKKSSSSQSQFLLGTVCSVNLYDDDSEKLYAEIFSCIKQIEEDFSTNISTSFVSKINQAAGEHAVEVNGDVLFVLLASIDFAQMTDGIFDPTIGPLVSLWGINTENAKVPSPAQIAKVLPLINWQNVEIKIFDENFLDKNFLQSELYENEHEKIYGTVFLKEKGMALDLGGIAKGFAADKIVKILEKRKVQKAIIDLGGNVYAFGTKNKNALWKIGVKNPAIPNGEPALVLEVSDSSVVTSGTYERFFEENGVRFHHILDTRTGYPAETEILSTTIVSKSSMLADAFSTTLFLLGKEKGFALLEKTYESDFSQRLYTNNLLDFYKSTNAIFITEDDKVIASENLENVLSATQNYKNEILFERQKHNPR